MAERSVTVLSFLLPVAMTIGTGLAIIFYKYSSLTLLLLNAGGGVLICLYVMMLRSDRRRRVG